MKAKCIYSGMADDPNNTTGDGLRESAEAGNALARGCIECKGTRAWAVKLDCDGRFYSKVDGWRVTGPFDGKFTYVDVEEAKRMKRLEKICEESIEEFKIIKAEMIKRRIA